MSDRTRGGPWVLVGGVVAALLLVVYPFVASDLVLRILTQALLFAYFAQCWNVAAGYAGQFSLGHPVFLAAGGYTSTLLMLRLGISPWLGMWVGAGIAALLAIAVAAVTVRYRVSGIYFALFTLAFWTVVEALISVWELGGRSSGLLLPIVGSWEQMLFPTPVAYYFLALFLVVAAALATRALARARLGRYFVAMREDALAAEAIGINTARTRVAAMAISGFMIAFGGTFYAQYFRFISPGTLLSFEPTLQMLLGTMIGGAGTILGPILGGFSFNILGELLRQVPFLEGGSKGGVFTSILYAVILILTILYLPGGLMDLFTRRTGRRQTPALAAPQAGELTPSAVDPDVAIAGALSVPAAPTLLPASDDARTLHEDRGVDLLRTLTRRWQQGAHDDAATADRHPLLKVEELTKRLGGLTAVNEVTFEVPVGGALGVIGPNGAGKTTLFNCLSGYMRPTSGRILFDGQDIAGLTPSSLCDRGLGRTFQITKPFPEMTALETVTVAVHSRVRHAREAQEQAEHILDFVRFRSPYDTLGKDLSVVNRKRLELARAVGTGPRLLLLDEICAGLNAAEVREVVELIHQVVAAGIAVVMVEHVLEAVLTISDRIVVLHYGRKIAEGAPHEVVRDPTVVEAYLGTSRAGHVSGRVSSDAQ